MSDEERKVRRRLSSAKWYAKKGRAHSAAYSSANPERRKTANRKWYIAKGQAQRAAARTRNPEKIKAAEKKWRANRGPEKQKQLHAVWRKKNIESVKAKQSLYKKTHPELVNATNARRRASKLQAAPVWANRKYIKLWYRFAQMETTRTGKPCDVDHIVPLRNKIVCGLHCEDNMQILFAHDNNTKRNFHWPNMPQEVVS